jgi:hypothetical protein
VLVGLSRVGLVGLREAIERASASGIEERDALVELMMNALAERNYISPASTEAYRLTLWREYLRHRGEDIRHLYSEIDVTVRAQVGPELERFRATLVEIFAEHELRPAISVAPPAAGAATPQLWIGDQLVVAGTSDRERIAKQVARQISDW